MKTKKFIAFIAAVVITAGAITTGTILLLQNTNKKPSGALTPASLMKPVSQIPTHLLPLPSSEYGYTAPYSHYIEFGEYPQTHVADTTLIAALNSSAAVKTGHKYYVNGRPSTSSTQTWTETALEEYAYGGAKYVKIGTHHAYAVYPMSSGTTAQTSNAWFKVEPLLWFVTGNDGTYLSLMAVNEIIAGIPFHSSGTTTYYNSGIRAFLNGTGAGTPAAAATAPAFTVDGSKSFLQTAFNTTAQGLINPTALDNINDQTNLYNPYNDNNDQNTTDKIYLPSYNDMTVSPFTTLESAQDAKRKSKPTDFAMANYAFYHFDYDAGQCWLRSAFSSTYLWPCSYDGALDGGIAPYPTNSTFGLRPAMQISISSLRTVGSVEALKRLYMTYTYNYDLNGAAGTPPTGGTIISGGTITLPAAPTHTGYTFSGWGVNNATTKTHNAGATGVAITADTTIYAIWTATGYTIQYTLNGGAWVSNYSPPGSYNTESLVVLPTTGCLTRANYTFLRWREANSAGAVVTTIQPGATGNKTYYAEWRYDNAAIDDLDYANTIAGLNKDIDGLNETIKELQKELEQKIIDAEKAAKDAAHAELDAEIEKLNYAKTIAALNKGIADLQEELEAANKELDEKLTEYMKAHANDYKYGYDDGYMAYVNEYAFVTWKILQGNEYVAGALTTYVLHDKVNTPYGTQIIAPSAPVPSVSSKQYIYTFKWWSLTPQMGATPNAAAELPKNRDATDLIYYAQYDRAVREYDINWVIPVVTDGQLDYTNATITTVTYKYGDAVTALIFTEIHGAGINYLPNGWSATQGGAKITDFGKCIGGRTFYARYTPKQTV